MDNLKHELKEDGFTLTEILVVIAVIGVLAAIAIPVYLNQKQKSIDASLQSDLKQMVNSQMTYIANGGLPHGTQVAFRPGDSENSMGSHNASGIVFNPTPGNYVRTPRVYDSDGVVAGQCVIVWSPNSKAYPTEGTGLAWSSVNGYAVKTTSCTTAY